LLLLGGLVVLTATACQVRTTVAVDVAKDGSGTVTVAVGLDADALGRVPDLDDDGRSTTADLTGLVRTDELAHHRAGGLGRRRVRLDPGHQAFRDARGGGAGAG
jgi:hypothetical protein